MSNTLTAWPGWPNEWKTWVLAPTPRTPTVDHAQGPSGFQASVSCLVKTRQRPEAAVGQWASLLLCHVVLGSSLKSQKPFSVTEPWERDDSLPSEMGKELGGPGKQDVQSKNQKPASRSDSGVWSDKSWGEWTGMNREGDAGAVIVKVGRTRTADCKPLFITTCRADESPP